MSQFPYYVRIRGRVSGPFDLPALQAMVRRRTLGRIDAVSIDEIQWVAADKIPGLFTELVSMLQQCRPSRGPISTSPMRRHQIRVSKPRLRLS